VYTYTHVDKNIFVLMLR